MHSDILIIGGDERNISKYDIPTFSLYKPIPAHLKPFRIFSLRTKIGLKFWQYKLKEDFLRQFKTIILFDCHEQNDLSVYIEKIVDPDIRLILFYWNPAILYNNVFIRKISQRWEKWSFDWADCKQYGFKYSGQLVFDKSIPEVETNDYDSDIFFIGIDKGRFKYLMPLEENLKRAGVNVQFRFVDNRKAIRNNRYSVSCSYADMIKYASKTKCMLEFNQKNQYGLTMRAIEAIIMGKKLITNNKDITKYDFYDPSRIFVLDRFYSNDVSASIKQFIESDINPYSKKIKDRYCFESWLNRILNNIQLNDFYG